MALNDIKNSVELLDGERPLRLQQRFLVLRKLGQGTYGKVQLALNKEKNEEVAIKTIKKGKIENAEDMLRIRREIHIMTVLRHPHIIHINEVFESRQKIVIVMQYASGGELYDYLGCHQTLPEDEARRLFRQIASAIYYCHKNQICHRDLKLENILLDEEGNAQIADFGLSNIFDAKRRLNTFCGSPLYASPEIVKGTPYKGPEVDCWSLGVLLYTLVYGTMPFDGRSFKELVSQISEGRYEEPVNKSSASSLIRRLLTPDVTQRATIHDVCTDNWINQGYDTSLLEEAENMALMAGLSPREQISVTKLCLEGKTKNGQDKSIFKKAAAQLEEKAGKITSFFTKNLESIAKTNDINSQMQKTALFHQITNYDVHYVLNKLIAAVEASLNADKNLHNSTSVKGNMHSENKIHKKETISEKVDSAYVIPIFEVTSNIPKDRTGSIKIINKKTENSKIMNSISKKIPTKESSNQNIQTKPTNSTKKQSNLLKNNNSMKSTEVQQSGCSVGQILRDSHKHIYSFNNTGEPQTHKTDFRSHTFLHHPTCKVKPVPTSQKNPNPFLRTKHHVLSLARLLSLNYEKLMRNSFRTQPCKKKLPGKITIPPTFDPNNPPTATKKQPDDKKELLIFPTISVSENKVKIEKKIEKIKKAALNKNLIIRSDTQTRMRIEKYIRSQVKKIQDLVCEDQRSIHASLEHLDEQSIRDMSEMCYCAFGSENTDSGIANTEDEEYFCFLCSRPNDASRFVDSFVLESLKKGCQYTSNHLHIPRPKEQIRWGYSTTNGEFGSLYRCRSEIQFPVEYLNYISSKNNKSDLQKRTQCKQQIQRSNFGNKNCFSTWEANTNPDSTNLRILRSASDSVGLNLNKNTFEILKLSTEGQDDMPQNYSLFPRFLEQTSTKGCNYSQMTDYETQSTATDATFINTSQILDKDDGIGDSNDSFQSYIDTFENNFENGADMSHLTNSKSYTNFSNANFKSQRSSKKILSEPHLINRYENFDDSDEENCDQGDILADILDCTSRVANLMSENQQIKPKLGGLRRRNTMTCIRDGNDFNESCRYSQSSTEFENYLWNAYKEHLLEANFTDSEYLSTQSFNSFSLDRKTKFRNHTSKSIDINGGNSTNDFEAKLLSLVTAIPGYESKTTSTTNLKNIRKNSNVRNAPEKPIRHLGRTKSICSDMLSDSDREEIIQKLRADRMSSLGNSTRYVSKGCRSPLTSTLLDDLEKKVDHSKQRRHFKSSLPSNSNKRNKSEYKKSFLQLLALKRIQEAEKELDKSSRNETSNVEGENPGSLLEALKTHGYKTVISQRFQDPNDDDLDPYHRKNLKSPRNLRAELARLNHMYYETMPMYTLDPCDEMDYSYEDLDCTRYMFNGLSSPSYDVPTNYKQRMPKQSVYDWLDSTQIDEYLNSLRSDLLNNSEETANSGAHRCCPQWKRETYHHSKEESSLEDAPQDINEISLGAINDSPKNKERIFSNEIKNLMDNNGLKLHSDSTEDERQETVHDRIWRKSFYSRFNNRALSRKRSSIIEPELSESRLGQLNDLYNNRFKTGYEKYEFLKRDCSNKSFHTKRPKNQSPSKESFESRGSTKKKCVKNYKKMDIELENEASSSNKDFIKVDNTE